MAIYSMELRNIWTGTGHETVTIFGSDLVSATHSVEYVANLPASEFFKLACEFIEKKFSGHDTLCAESYHYTVADYFSNNG